MIQEYEKYLKQDHEIWSVLFQRQMVLLKEIACEEYLEALKKMPFEEDELPRYSKINEVLQSNSGWEIHVVPGLISEGEFFNLLSQKRFCASTWIRDWEQIDYIVEPDMFHDIFGHIPLLVNKQYCKFVLGLAQVAKKFENNEWALKMLQRIYWFTIEFGLIRQEGKIKAYGAGILSSPGEAKYCVSNQPDKLEFDPKVIFDNPFKIDEIQPRYYVIDSFQDLLDSLSTVESLLESNFPKVD